MTAAQKNLALLGVLGVLAAGLGLYAYFGVRKPEEREAQRKESAEKLFSTQAPEPKRKQDGGAPAEAEFTAINVRAKGETTTLEKRDSRWWITSPVFSLADKWHVLWRDRQSIRRLGLSAAGGRQGGLPGRRIDPLLDRQEHLRSAGQRNPFPR